MSSLDVRAIDEKDLRKTPAPAAKQEFRVFLSEQAFDRAVERGDGDITREIGGVLVGEVLRDDAGPYLRIDSTIDALHAEEKGAELTFTHATWEHIHKEMDGKYKDKKVVGWYHTHPGFGIFLSDRDQFIQKSFFNLPFQVALVYDPKSREHGIFTWHDNEIWRARRYWIGSREQVWDGSRTPPPPPEKKDKDKAAKAKSDDDASDDHDRDRDAGASVRDDSINLGGSLTTMIMLAIVMLLLGGLIGHWFGANSAGIELARAQSEALGAKGEAARAIGTTIQSELIGVLRDTIDDRKLYQPVLEAAHDLDVVLADLPGGEADEHAAAPPAGAGSGSGSAAAKPVAGSGSAAPAAGAGSGSAALAAGRAAAPAPPAPPVDPRMQQLAVQLRGARDKIIQLAKIMERRATAELVLTELDQIAHQVSEQRTDLSRDVAQQRSGVGELYAELAVDAVKANDPARARRLLNTAAHIDPGNRTRYEKQLQSFDKAASLSREPETTDATGSAGQGSQR